MPASSGVGIPSSEIEEFVRSDEAATRADRRWFHEHPELSGQEEHTKARISEIVASLGFTVTPCGKGLRAEFPSASKEPMIAYRADIDALPIREDARHTCRSSSEGVMHACGHDGHIAVALALCRFVARHREELPQPVRFLFQPSEEKADGALDMIADGALEGVSHVIGLHFWTPFDVGQVVVQSGAVFGNVDTFKVTVRGTGGHGGMPHRTHDPIVASAHIITALQSIVSRQVDPGKPAVVTVGMIHGGTAFNVVPGEVVFEGTVRTFDEDVQSAILLSIREIAEHVASSLGTRAEVMIRNDCPAVVNDPAVVAHLEPIFADMETCQRVPTTPITVGDDMSYFQRTVPGCYLLFGSGNVHMENREHHQSEFDLDERSLPLALGFMIRALLRGRLP